MKKKIPTRQTNKIKKIIQDQIRQTKAKEWKKLSIKVSGVKKRLSERTILKRINNAKTQKTNKKYTLALYRLKQKQARNSIQKEVYSERYVVEKRRFKNKKYLASVREYGSFTRMSKQEYIAIYGENDFMKLMPLEQGWYYGMVDEAKEIIVYLN